MSAATIYKQHIEEAVLPELDGLITLLDRPSIHIELPGGRVGDADTKKAVALSPSALAFLYRAYREMLPEVIQRAKGLARASILEQARAAEAQARADARKLEEEIAAIRAILEGQNTSQ